MSRSVWLKREEERADSHNDGTLSIAPLRCRVPGLPSPPRSFEDEFRRHYETIRGTLNGHREPGLALFVTSGDGIEASAWVKAEDDEIRPLILGRHNDAEIFLPSDPALSLRHLAVIVKRRDGPVRYRVLDLRTATAFEDEQGRRLEALESDGPTLLRCAAFALLLLPTGAGQLWPDDAAEALTCLPGRVHIDCASADPDRWAEAARASRYELRRPEHLGSASLTTTSVSFPGPVFLSPLLAEGGPARGELLLASGSGRASLRLGKEAARQGVLLGRYERCDGGGLPMLSSPSLSRVHLLIVEVGATLCAIDTASHNGTRLGERRVHHARLEPGRPLILADDVSVEWRPFH